ncbi:hypothetical protein I5Q34_03755 [Streptomyces sp. AV19]|uniref:DUF5336 domain-containing protein n=1 Tax=Streptomyces sp. AV19 TaxID=2793068 RepID=UPI0018FE6654|nr:DUF5336 domain-containing protein [Streptomyces sp. AV19]MBH1933409.1 hypothetical protein [Streptomyces sp. AV19]MDG4532040.1 DUF5336 domain-containing protein [Streptomyces sp. AV19]
MNLRSLTRGDGVVIGAAVLLFIASFLDYYSLDCSGDFCGKADLPNLWSSKVFPALPSIVLAGLVGAALIIGSRFQPEGRKALGLTLEQWGTALAVFATWTVLWTLFDGPVEHGDKSPFGVGIGRILAFIATLLIAATALLAARIPALKAPLMGAPRPQTPASPYGTGAHPGYGYPGPGGPAGPGAPFGGQPYGGAPQPDPSAGQPVQGTGPVPAADGQAQAPAPAPAADFVPFWFAVPVNRPLFPEDGSPTPIAELAPGTWYLAVDQRGPALVAQTQDGRRGVLQDTSGIQRG